MAVGILWLASAAQAATWRVASDGSGDFSSIQAAIDAAGAGDAIEVGPGTWSEVLDFLGKDVVVRSTDGADATVLDGGGNASFAVAFDSGEPSTAALEGFTVVNAGQRGVYVAYSGATLRQVRLQNLGSSDQHGGSIYAYSGSVALEDVTVEGGVGYYGGGVYAYGSTVAATGTTFQGCDAVYGGAIFADGGSLSLDASTVTQSRATSHGGGVWANGAISLVESIVSANETAEGNGAGLYLSSGTLEITGGEIAGNAAEDYATTLSYGGGLYLGYATSAILTDVTVTGNAGYYGGGIYQEDGAAVELSGGLYTLNYGYYGGAFQGEYGASVDVRDATFEENTAVYYGAGLYLYAVGTIDVQRTIFSENTSSSGYGAAMMTYYSNRFDIVDSTFEENYAYYYGGAIYAYSEYGGISVLRSAFTDNETAYGGGAIIAYYSAMDVEGCAFSGNRGTYDHGGVLYGYGLTLDVKDSTFEDNGTETKSGGALYLYASGSAAIAGSRFADNEAGGDGGAIAAISLSSLSVSGLELANNASGGAGGALYVGTVTDANGSNNAFTENEATYGGGLYLAEIIGGTWTNNTFLYNEARIGGAGCLVESGLVYLINNSLVANAAAELGPALCLYDAGMALRNSVIAYHGGGEAVYAYDDASDSGTFLTYNDWFQNAGGDLGGTLEADELENGGNITADPAFYAFSTSLSAEDVSLVLRQGSPLIDAGDPTVLDPDGSRSDIGAAGGPGAPWEDGDGDGVSSQEDCDDGDDAVHPGADDAWYDGIDADCGGEDDYDADGDGAPVDADCDDADPDLIDCPPEDTGEEQPDEQEDSGETPDDGDDPAPLVPAEDEKGGCSALGGSPAGVGAAALALLALLRRRRN